jgi:hypothetical protein
MKLHELHEAVGRSVADLQIEYLSGDFLCSNNRLTSLEGSPSKVGGNFYCDKNSLTSLKGAPSEVDNFSCSNNNLTSLKGAPSKVGGNFYCGNNSLTSLKGAPSKVGSNFYCNNNNLTSLEGIHLQISSIAHFGDFSNNPIKSHVLGLLLIDGLNHITLDNTKVEKIINKYLKGSRDVFDCQNELMDAGFDAYAQL